MQSAYWSEKALKRRSVSIYLSDRKPGFRYSKRTIELHETNISTRTFLSYSYESL